MSCDDSEWSSCSLLLWEHQSTQRFSAAEDQRKQAALNLQTWPETDLGPVSGGGRPDDKLQPLLRLQRCRMVLKRQKVENHDAVYLR